MSGDDLPDDLPEELRALLAHERAAVAAPGAAAKARVLGRLEDTLGLGGGGTGGGGGGGGGGGAGGGGGGGGLSVAAAPAAKLGFPVIAAALASLGLLAGLVVADEVREEPVREEPVREEPVREEPAKVRKRPPELAATLLPTLADEQRLLDAARAALANGDPSSAERDLRVHETRFPRGQLAEERAALLVLALHRAGKGDEAAREAAAFRARWPESLHGSVVESALGEGGER